ncbi:HET-domain-containing protein, partial [Setomelanomma holmii]
MAYAEAVLPNKRSVRLLQLLSGCDQAPLEARLEVHTLGDSCSYAALSYVWGTPDQSKALHTATNQLKISENLYSFLTHLRQPDTTRTIWVDAICINQEDDGEKSSQVALMGSIYREAETVFCWLGHPTSERLLALKHLQRLANESTTYIGPDSVENIEAHVDCIYSNPWFTRLWVVQEVSLARRPKFLCGRHEMSWNDFERAA